MTAEPRRRSSWFVWIAGALVLLPVLYVASVGPAIAIYRLRVISLGEINAYEVPLVWAMQNGPEWFSKAVLWYLEPFDRIRR